MWPMRGVLKGNLDDIVTVGRCNPDNGYHIKFESGTEEVIRE